MLDHLSQFWDDRDRLLNSSFSHVSLELAAEMAEDWYRGLLLESDPIPNWLELADYLEVTTINIDGRTAEREFVEDILDTQRMILAYTTQRSTADVLANGRNVMSLMDTPCPASLNASKLADVV